MNRWLYGCAVALLCAAPLAAQDMLTGEGWEAFPMVDYKGGDSQFRKKGYGIVVLTDSTIAFYVCENAVCGKHKGRYFSEERLIWSHPIKSIVDVSASTANKGPSVAGRVTFGVLATDNNEEYFGFTYETDKTAESPVFKVPKTFAGAMEAKLKFRMKRLGMAVPQ